ncbi:MAG: hypothetical protein KGP35_01220 [Bacteroidetes bacterium]|nr:hypothetical protein [Bacteroidota bacterium]
MNQILNNALEQAKIAKVHVFPKSARRQISLFDDDMTSDISFNGFTNPTAYQHHLDSFYANCKQQVGADIAKGLDELDSLKRLFDLYKFEVREFRHRYFPKNDPFPLFDRIELVKASRSEYLNDEGLKKNS